MATELIDHFEETDEPQKWHRQRVKGAAGHDVYETARAYDLFKRYAAMGAKRSFVKLSQEVGKSRQYIERIASRWQWAERTRAFDSHVSDIEMAAFIGERRAMARRQADLAVLGQNIATRGLMQLQEDLQAEAARRHLKVHELVRLLDVSAKLERANRGEPDEDQVASIHVTIMRQTRPRYEEAGWTEDDAKPKLDS
jgi:hypothetical protein